MLAQEPCAEWLKSGDADKAGRAVGGLAAAVMIQPSTIVFYSNQKDIGLNCKTCDFINKSLSLCVCLVNM